MEFNPPQPSMNSRNHRVHQPLGSVRHPSRVAGVLARYLLVLTGAHTKTAKQTPERFIALAPDQRVREMGEW